MREAGIHSRVQLKILINVTWAAGAERWGQGPPEL